MALPGVKSARVSLADSTALVTVDGSKASTAESVASAVSDIGFEASVTVETTCNASVTISVKGMHCNSCTRSIEDKLRSNSGVQSVKVSLLAETATVCYDPSVITVEQLLSAIESVGDFNASVLGGRYRCILLCLASI